jgi:hypothetical protein
MTGESEEGEEAAGKLAEPSPLSKQDLSSILSLRIKCRECNLPMIHTQGGLMCTPCNRFVTITND